MNRLVRSLRLSADVSAHNEPSHSVGSATATLSFHRWVLRCQFGWNKASIRLRVSESTTSIYFGCMKLDVSCVLASHQQSLMSFHQRLSTRTNFEMDRTRATTNLGKDKEIWQRGNGSISFVPFLVNTKCQRPRRSGAHAARRPICLSHSKMTPKTSF